MSGCTPARRQSAPVKTSSGVAGILQRTCSCGAHTGAGEQCDECKKKKMMLQRHSPDTALPAMAPPIVHDVLRSPGQPLDQGTRAAMETHFGHDFSQVRVHMDSTAGASARAVNAHAYTVGQHIAFAAGQYQPQTPSGHHLLRHELAHSIQQGGLAPPAGSPLEIGPASDPLEAEADRMASADVPEEPRGRDGNVVRRQTADAPAVPSASTSAAAPAAADAQPQDPTLGPYGGCNDSRAIIAARTEASTKAGNAVAALNNMQAAAPLLAAHFHLDPTQAANQDALNRVRGQFTRMKTALDSGIRIFCRSAPRSGLGMPAATMPVDPQCAHDNAHSTSCAAGNATATVTLCEMTLLGMGDGPLSKTILHEFAHIACNGNPRIQSGGRNGGEVYYDGAQLPGNAPNVIDQADSYAWFALNAPASQAATGPGSGAQSSQGGLPGWAIALLAIGGAALVGGAIGLGAYLGNH
jgi:Domain of unknown function (DUF4157)